jgi:FMN phosphatase YigB (HAD superfamily)
VSSTPLALFDLDDTLSDRESGFRNWAKRWIERHGLDEEEALPWLVATDSGGYTDRVELFAQAAERFGLHESPEALADDYRRTSHSGYRHDPVVVAGLQSVVDAGWRVGVVTNGGPGQDEKVDRIGIRPLLSCCVVSDTVGIRKPDPRIFALAVDDAGGAEADQVWMVGDHPVNDIVGADKAGLRTVWIAHGRTWPAELAPPDVIVASLDGAFAHLRELAG